MKKNPSEVVEMEHPPPIVMEVDPAGKIIDKWVFSIIKRGWWHWRLIILIFDILKASLIFDIFGSGFRMAMMTPYRVRSADENHFWPCLLRFSMINHPAKSLLIDGLPITIPWYSHSIPSKSHNNPIKHRIRNIQIQWKSSTDATDTNVSNVRICREKRPAIGRNICHGMGSCGGRPFPGSSAWHWGGHLYNPWDQLEVGWLRCCLSMFTRPGKPTKNYRKIHHFQWEKSKSTISMVILNSYVTNYQRVSLLLRCCLSLIWFLEQLKC